MSRRHATMPAYVFRVRILGGHFRVKLVRTGEAEPGARYPPVVAGQGQSPPQYPDLDDEDDWDESLFPELTQPKFAPVELAPPPQLQTAAAAAPTIRRLRALVEWVGEGRKLTAAGNLTPADAKELAGLLGLVDPDRLAGLRLRSAQDIAGLALSSFPGGLAEALLDLLSLLYATEGPVSVGELAGHFWEEHVEATLDEQAAGRPELWRLATAVETAQYVGQLQGLGMVQHEATPLGTWWTNILLRQASAVAPVIREPAGAAAVLAAAGRGHPNPQFAKAARKAAFKFGPA